MFENILNELESILGKFTKFPEASCFEKCILLLKENNKNYAQIQKYLGNPSRDIIRSVILKYEPDLLNKSNIKIKSKINPEKRIIGLIKKFYRFTFDLDEFDKCCFNIQDEKLTFCTEYGERYNFEDLDERTQLSILYNIARILNIDIKSTEFNNK